MDPIEVYHSILRPSIRTWDSDLTISEVFIPGTSVVHYFSYEGGEVEKVTKHDRAGEQLHYH